MTDLTKLKDLAERATPGPWTTDHGHCIVADNDQLNGGWVVSECHGSDWKVNLQFCAAANPQAILGLIERLEKAERHWANENQNNMALIAEVERLRTAEGDALTYKAGMETVAVQRDRLKAENEALRKIISECATACGAAVSTECSLDFMKMLPQEIVSVIGGLRKQLEQVHQFKFAGPLEAPDLKCAACGGYHYGLPPNMPCPKNAAIAQDAALEGGGR